MAQIELQTSHLKTRRKVHSFLRIDMTPMVDLGFLLITFFIFTTTMSDKKTMRLIVPAEGKPTPVKEKKVLTVLLSGNNKVFAYEGQFQEAIKKNQILPTNYNETEGIGKLIRLKQNKLSETKEKDDLIFIVKPSAKASYKNVIDALDETTINNVKKYVVVDPSSEEEIFLESSK